MKQNDTFWKPVPGLDGYEASSAGQLRTWLRVTEEIFRRHKIESDGKKCVQIIYKTERASSPEYVNAEYNQDQKVLTVRVIEHKKLKVKRLSPLIAAAFGLKAPGKDYVLRHRNYQPYDSKPSNLVWRRKCDSTKNKAGAAIVKKTLAEKEAKDIRWLLYRGLLSEHISVYYCISRSLVSLIKSGKRWPNAGGPVFKDWKYQGEREELDEKCDHEINRKIESALTEIQCAAQRKDSVLLEEKKGVKNKRNAPLFAELNDEAQQEFEEDSEHTAFREMVLKRNEVLKTKGIAVDAFLKYARQAGCDLDSLEESLKAIEAMCSSFSKSDNAKSEESDDF